jgi:hypothetical protein
VGRQDEVSVSSLPIASCARRAWLALPSGQTIQLDNPAGGWSCQSLDLGSPVVRSVMTNRPDADGIIDRTQYMGARTVVAAVSALSTAGARIDDVASAFAPFMLPSARPVLHYVLDRHGAPERTLTLRPDSYDWPIVGAIERDVALQWIAADPVARDVNVQTATAWAGTGSGSGRLYNLTYPRIYPSGSSSAVSGRIQSAGDVPVRPLLSIYGPVTGPQVILASVIGSGQVNWSVVFTPTTRIDAGHRIDVDTAAHTAFYDGDPTQNVLGQLDWRTTVWPVLPPSPSYTIFVMYGQTTTTTTQTQAIWQDGYLT